MADDSQPSQPSIAPLGHEHEILFHISGVLVFLQISPHVRNKFMIITTAFDIYRLP
jgi:hypothetical protein